MESARFSEQTLNSEQAFFDAEAASVTDAELMIAPDQMARYRNAKLRARNIPKETMFALLGSLEGKEVLEYGCGMGHDSCHFADCGAKVTAFDLSPGSVQKAKRRAELLGLADRITFDVRVAGQTGYETGRFDAVIGMAILHHLHQDLPAIYGEIARVLKPGGVAFFIEPVANSKLLKKLRPVVPVPTNATPDERQLEYADFELMKKHGFDKVEYHHFHGLARLRRVFGDWASTPLNTVDHYLQRVFPFLKPLYGILVVRATRR